jgi:D-alanyl-lipoteichoic acid acyltransferase DltB (MBOAT superfamily)
MTLPQFQAVTFIVFTLLLFLGLFTTSARVIELRRRDQSLPTLLIRDLIMLVGLAWPFAAVLVVRAFTLGPLVTGQFWWYAVTTIPPIIAVGVYCYFELFVIGKSRR